MEEEEAEGEPVDPTGTERTLGRDADREREEREDREEVDR